MTEFTLPGFVEPVSPGNAPECALEAVVSDGVAPDNFHAMSIYPEYFRVEGAWHLAKDSRMDCVAVWEDGRIIVREFRLLKKGDLVVTGRTEDGSEGIFVHANAFPASAANGEVFAFRRNRSRETAFSLDYDEITSLLRHEKAHGKIVWVLGPAVSFDYETRRCMARLIGNGYCHALLAGNALATHDMEAELFGTALGQEIYTRYNRPNGHYNHLELINRVRKAGSVPAFLKNEKLTGGIIAACERNNVPYVLTGSIRDDGPLPPVFANVYDGQDAMRNELRGATTVICMATMLHTIAAGNMTPSYRVLPDGTVRPVYFYCVDISEFTVRKLSDRGSLTSRGIVTNVQDFVKNLDRALI